MIHTCGNVMQKMMGFCKCVNFIQEGRNSLNEYKAYLSMLAFARMPKLLGDHQGHISSLAHVLQDMDADFITESELLLADLKYDHDLSHFIEVQESVTSMFNANEKEKDILIDALFSREL